LPQFVSTLLTGEIKAIAVTTNIPTAFILHSFCTFEQSAVAADSPAPNGTIPMNKSQTEVPISTFASGRWAAPRAMLMMAKKRPPKLMTTSKSTQPNLRDPSANVVASPHILQIEKTKAASAQRMSSTTWEMDKKLSHHSAPEESDGRARGKENWETD
jgi:hypothetical protein